MSIKFYKPTTPARRNMSVPSFEESITDEPVAAQPAAEPAAEPAAPSFEAVPVTDRFDAAAAAAAEPGDTLPRMETPVRRRPMTSPRGGAGMPMSEKPVQRKGGYTIDIDDSSSASLNARAAAPAPAASLRDPAAFGDDESAFAASAPLGEQPSGGDDDLGTPASLFKRRR